MKRIKDMGEISMSEKEALEQLESLIEAWNLEEADLNQTDIKAIKFILQENQQLKEQLKNIKPILKYYDNLREELGIDDWLELVKEDKNLDSAYISFAQYMDILEKENKQLKEKIDIRNKEKTDICNKIENQKQKIKRYKSEITNLIFKNKKIKCQIKQRDEVIDESIRHIENHMRCNCRMNCGDMNFLLDILKGEEDE